MKNAPVTSDQINEIINSIDTALAHLINVSKAEFTTNIMVQDATIFRLALIGELLNHINSDFQQQHPEIPWRSIIGLRNLIIHEYSRVTMDQIYDTVIIDLVHLKKQLQHTLEKLPPLATPTD
jgi:uncharacterized protein with HEPN domain